MGDGMGNQNKGKPEKYSLEHWRGIPERSRGPKRAPAFRYKLEFARWLDKAPDLSASQKRVGVFLVWKYNENHRPHGCAWPARKYIAAELGLDASNVRKATNKLHERGYIHKTVGGGWHRGKIRHRSSEYLPAFSRIANSETWALLKNAPHLSAENAEAPGNPGEEGGILPRGQNASPSDNGFSRFSGEVRGQNASPRSDNVVADANASPDTPNGSTASLAPAPEIGWIVSTDVGSVARLLNIPVSGFLAAMAGWEDTGVSTSLLALCHKHTGRPEDFQHDFTDFDEHEDDDGEPGTPSEKPSAIIELKRGEPMSVEGGLDLDPGERIWIRFPTVLGGVAASG